MHDLCKTGATLLFLELNKPTECGHCVDIGHDYMYSLYLITYKTELSSKIIMAKPNKPKMSPKHTKIT